MVDNEPIRVVAQSPSKWGGTCQRCKNYIPVGGLVFKLNYVVLTHHGNGPGKWVCGTCKDELVGSHGNKEER